MDFQFNKMFCPPQNFIPFKIFRPSKFLYGPGSREHLAQETGATEMKLVNPKIELDLSLC